MSVEKLYKHVDETKRVCLTKYNFGIIFNTRYLFILFGHIYIHK